MSLSEDLYTFQCITQEFDTAFILILYVFVSILL